MRVFLDTNILIDLLDGKRLHHEASTAVFQAVQSGRISAGLTAISVLNAIYVLRRALPPGTIAAYPAGMRVPYKEQDLAGYCGEVLWT